MVLAVLELIVHVDQGSFKFRDLSASASQVLKLKVQATTTGTTIKTQHCVCLYTCHSRCLEANGHSVMYVLEIELKWSVWWQHFYLLSHHTCFASSDTCKLKISNLAIFILACVLASKKLLTLILESFFPRLSS